MSNATPTSVITAIKGLVEGGNLPDVYGFVTPPWGYAGVDFSRDTELNGYVVVASQEDPEGGVELALVRRQSRVIFAEAKVNGLSPKAVALIVVAMLASIDDLS